MFWSHPTQKKGDLFKALYTNLCERRFITIGCPSLTKAEAVKRRTLPAWIREGLEKMDREKQRKMERERMEQERATLVKEEEEEPEEAGEGPRIPRKSKFVRDTTFLLYYITWLNVGNINRSIEDVRNYFPSPTMTTGATGAKAFFSIRNNNVYSFVLSLLIR